MRFRRRAVTLAVAMLIGCGAPPGDEARQNDSPQADGGSAPATTSGTSAPSVISAASETVVLSVPSMSCPLCARSIEARLDEAGVRDVDIDLETKRVRAGFDPSRITAAEITALVEGQGFPVTESRRGSGPRSEPER